MFLEWPGALSTLVSSLEVIVEHIHRRTGVQEKSGWARLRARADVSAGGQTAADSCAACPRRSHQPSRPAVRPAPTRPRNARDIVWRRPNPKIISCV